MDYRIFSARLVGLTLVVCGLVVGCGKKSSGTANPRAFDQAPPDVKQFWDSAQAADKTNGYAAAQELYFGLLRQNLTPQQKQAVTDASTALNERFNSALEKGDATAQQALKEMRKNPPNRPR